MSSLEEESSFMDSNINLKSKIDTSEDIVVGESSYEDSSDTEDEESIIRPTRTKKAQMQILESDESESEISQANIEHSETSDESDDQPQIESDESEHELQSSSNKSKGTVSERNELQQSSSKNKIEDSVSAIQKTPNNNEGKDEKLKKVEGRPSLWEENDVLSSTRIYRPSETFGNPLNTPRQMSKIPLKESFLTPREVKRVSSDSEDEDSTELVDLKENSLKKSAETRKSSSSTGAQSRKSDIIEVSSDEEIPPPTPIKPKLTGVVQTKLNVYAKPFKSTITEVKTEPSTNFVTQDEFNAQKNKVFRLEQEWTRNNNILRTVNLSGLPDKGELLLMRHDRVEKELKEEREKFQRMVVHQTAPSNPNLKEKILSTWDDVQQATDLVQPRTFGKQAMATLNAEKALTMELLSQLHSSLKKCPDENILAQDPPGLKVELMPHQKRALAWLMFRETQQPAGGILADDMGLGKTLTMISLVLKEREVGAQSGEENENEKPEGRSKKCKGGTLVVCPASLASQWEGEVARRTRRGLLDVEVYHGPKRERKPKRLASHDMVITTYSIVQNEHEKEGTVFGVQWHRIILDEAHQIRNHKSRTAHAVCALSAHKRWALTGTPVHNKEEDMYALLKFLRCSPFDDLAVWRRWIANKNMGGQNRLSAVISSLLLRRTKADLQAAGALNCLPERNWELITVDLDKQEMDIYHKVLVFSRTLFAQFLHQRAEKQEDSNTLTFTSAGAEYFKMHQKLVKLNRVKEIKQHHILVLLLRLRQICCHPCLITSMLENIDGEENDENEEDSEELNILEQLKRLELEDDHYDPAVGLSEEPVGLAEASKGILNPSHPVFSTERRSSKIKVVLQLLKDRVLSTGDKAIIVSQWTSLLQLIAQHLKSEGVQFNELNGSIPVHKRMGLVDDFNNPKHPVKVMLLSLTAGGVGLNLVGGNHLFLVDLHWNPQLEMQAQDRIYRVGQKKQVNVYKFMTVETIEERIKKLQDNKLAIADSMLTGSKIQSSKLTLTDLKMLFNM